jgi:hypothetical protein
LRRLRREEVVNNMPEELRMMAEALIHSATKHGFAFVGTLFKDDETAPVIAVIRNTKEKNPAEVFRAIANIIDDKVTAGEVVEHRVSPLA